MLERDRYETIERYRAATSSSATTRARSAGTRGGRTSTSRQSSTCSAASSKSILDIGCGFGDLFGYLKGLGWRGDYVGYDLCPELIEEGRKRFGPDGAQFECADFASSAADVRADVAVAIGIFNHKLHGDNWEFVQSTLKAMWGRTHVAVAADFLSATADKPHEHLFHVPASRVLDLGLSLSKRAVLKHDYMPFEFSMAVWHDDSFEPDCPVLAPYRKHIDA